MKKNTFVDWVILGFCTLLAIIMILPFYNVVIRSFATPAAIAKQPFYMLPTSFDISTYKVIFAGGKLQRAFMISTFVTLAGTLLSMFLSVLGGYVLSKNDLPGRRFFTVMIIITMFFNGGLIPYYLNIKDLGLSNNVMALFLPNAINTFYLIIMINYFKSVPVSLEESAKIDGASQIRTLFSIILPISKPTLAAITLFYAVDYWNEWWNALLFLSNEKLYPMQLYLREILVDVDKMANSSMAAAMMGALKKTTPDGIKMATVVVTIIPVMIIYPMLQKHFAAGVMVGAVKE